MASVKPGIHYVCEYLALRAAATAPRSRYVRATGAGIGACSALQSLAVLGQTQRGLWSMRVSYGNTRTVSIRTEHSWFASKVDARLNTEKFSGML